LIRATLIYNPVAGRDPARRQAQIRKAADALRGSGFVLAVQPTPGPASAGGLAQAAARDGAELVIVCGGDGTINEVINGLVHEKIPLAILPGGTANIAARELRLPHRIVAAARELPGWRPRRIALGRVVWGDGPAGSDGAARDPAPASTAPSARYFLSVAGIGYDAYVVHRLDLKFKEWLGVLAYGWEAVRQVWHYAFPVLVCRSEDREWRGTFALVQRGERYAGWLHLVPGASLFDDRLRLCLFESARPSRYFLYAAAVLLRRHLVLKDVRRADFHRVACSAANPRDRVYVELDGELAGELPARFEIVPDALTLLTPPA
jgi:diacylglycerol kinase (ATP)